MTPLTLLRTPWRSAYPSMRWTAVVVFSLACLAAVAVAVLPTGKEGPLMAVGILGFGEGFLWAFFVSGLLLLAIDARKLRLPGLQREIHASLGLYAVLSVAPATALAAAFGTDVATVCALLALCSLAGLAFVLLPRPIAMLMGFVPALHAGLKRVLDIPAPGEPDFVPWASTAIAVLLLACILRWRHLLRAHESAEGFSGAVVLQFRRNSGWGGWSSERFDSLQRVRRRPDWLQPRADLKGVGPDAPSAALRVALGHWYTPRSVAGHLHAAAPVALSLLCAVGAMVLIGLSNGHRHGVLKLLEIGSIAAIGWLGVFGTLTITLVTTQLVQARWRKPNTELPLMALLPGLGGTSQARRALLLAILRRPLGTQAVLLVAMLAVGLGLHLPALGMASIAVSQLGSAAVLAACVPAVLGGRPLPTWGLVLGGIALFVLVSLGSFLPLTATGDHPWEGAQRAIGIVLALWLAFGVLLAWIGHRGWPALIRRPHPFLLNEG